MDLVATVEVLKEISRYKFWEESGATSSKRDLALKGPREIWAHIQKELISDLNRFFVKEISRVIEWLQEIKTADQWGTALLYISFNTAK